jgi:hypothetical protein
MFGNNLNNILLIAAIGIILYIALTKNNSNNIRERYVDSKSTSSETTEVSSVVEKNEKKSILKKPVQVKVAPKEFSNQQGASVNESNILNPNVQVTQMDQYPGPFEGCAPKQKELKPEDLLPKDMNTKWAQVNPTGQGMLADRNFLDAGHHVGINTVGQSLRNANYNVRSEIPNPQVKVSPWMQSTIDPDVGRKPMEIGSGW